MSVYRWCNNFVNMWLCCRQTLVFWLNNFDYFTVWCLLLLCHLKRKLFKSTIMPVEVLISIVKDWYEWLVSGLVHLLSNDPFRRSGLMPCRPISHWTFMTSLVCKVGLHYSSASINQFVTQRQLMRLFAVKVILSYEQKCQVSSKFLKNLSMLKNKLWHKFYESINSN